MAPLPQPFPTANSSNSRPTVKGIQGPYASRVDPDRLVARPSISTIAAEIDGELSLYQPSSETVAILNGTASDIWWLCDGINTVADTVARLATAYSVETNSIRPEVIRVVVDLIRQGFLQEVPATD